MSAQPELRITPEEYLEIERLASTKSEYFDGEIFSMSGGTLAHSRIGANMITILSNHLRDRPCEVNTSDMRVKVEATGLYTYPDASVVCGEALCEHVSNDTLLNPILIVEVLSPSTEGYDRGTKFDHYRQIPSLSEYLLVSQDQARLECFSRKPDGEWVHRVASGFDANLLLLSIDCMLQLDQVYHKATLRPTDRRAAQPLGSIPPKRR